MIRFAQYPLLYKFVALWRVARPLQLLAFIALYVAGITIAIDEGYAISMSQFVWGIVPLLIAGTSIHYSNEYADVETDKLARRTPFSGGSRVLAEGIMTRKALWRGIWILLGITLMMSGLCTIFAKLTSTAFLLLMIGLFFGWMYSLPPLKLGWRGLGELDNAILGGNLLALYGYAVVVDEIRLHVMLMFLPFTGMVFINLLATTWADRDADAIVRKYTLATQLSISTLRQLYALVTLSSYGCLILFANRFIPQEIVVGCLLISPIVVWGYRNYTRILSPHPTVYAMIMMMSVYVIGLILQIS